MVLASIVTFDLEKTQKGFPAFWEKGGGCRNTGTAYIVANRDGKAKRAVYVRRRGHLANEHHALLVIERGDYIIVADHHREDFTVCVWQVEDIIEKCTGALVAACIQRYFFDRGEWITEPPAELETAIDAAVQKALCYHCREPHHVVY